MGVDGGGLLAAQAAVRALKPRLVPALVVDVPVLVPLQGEPAAALLALERFLLVAGVHLQAAPLRASVSFQTTLPHRTRSILADHALPERKRQDMES